MLDRWYAVGIKVFNHYTLYGSWNASGGWGAKESVSSSLEASPKFRALVDWIRDNP